jgi:hypothetical protein
VPQPCLDIADLRPGVLHPPRERVAHTGHRILYPVFGGLGDASGHTSRFLENRAMRCSLDVPLPHGLPGRRTNGFRSVRFPQRGACYTFRSVLLSCSKAEDTLPGEGRSYHRRTVAASITARALSGIP